MISFEGALICEGKYDKIKLANMIDCPIITTDGFGVFKSPEKRELIKRYAKIGPVAILTDSDSAGFKIRSYIKGFLPKAEIINVYIPDVYGKESRKREPSAEGKLGVEGMSEKILSDAFKKAGIGIKCGALPDKKRIERIDLYSDGFFGGPDSSYLRARLLKELDLPGRLSTSGLLDFLNAAVGHEKYKELAEKITGSR